MIKNPPSNAKVPGSIPCQGTKVPHAVGHLSQRAMTETQRTQIHTQMNQQNHNCTRTERDHMLKKMCPICQIAGSEYLGFIVLY